MRNSVATIILIPAFLAVAPLVAAQQLFSEQLLADVERYRAQLDQLELDVGRYHPSLLEPLQSLGESLIELDQFEETDEVLDRVIQILRVNEGLFTNSQLQYQILTAKNQVRRGDWANANETLGHLGWLYSYRYIGQADELLEDLLQLYDLHLEGVASDSAEMRIAHLRLAERILWEAVKIAEQAWGETDSRLIDLYYRAAMQYYLFSVASKQGGSTSANLRQFISGVPQTTESKRDTNKLFYGLGMYWLQRIQQVFESAHPPDQESIALVQLYQADWQVIFNQDNPRDAHSLAFAALQQAGVPAQQLDDFFACPRILPLRSFYGSIEQAQQSFRSVKLLQEQRDADCPSLMFVEWSSALPNIQVPIEQPQLLQQEIEDMHTARVLIRLRSSNRVARWFRGRYVARVSVTDDFDWINQSSNQSIGRDDLTERLHSLHFRPVLKQGIPQLFEGNLEYRYFSVDRD